MKILYAIQGTGNGHLSRARDIIPILQKKTSQLDILVSGTQADIHLPFPITYQLKGLSFIFGKKGGVDFWKTYFKSKTFRLHDEITHLPVENYDLIINDFEPVSAWACKLKNIPCISLSHQSAVLSEKAPKPNKKDPVGELILKKYAPATKHYGFHFKAYGDYIFTPVIRQDIRNAECKIGEHYTVYLPSYDDEKILKILSKIEAVRWEVFSKQNKKTIVKNNVSIQPITNDAFVKSMATSKGILCGGGFETPAEALFMQKKLLVVPMKGQYEQQCNAAALKEMGVPVIKSFKNKYLTNIIDWIKSDTIIEVHYPDSTEQIIDQLLKENL